MTLPETPLQGGRVTAGVVKVGDTVRRPISGDHALRHALLAHLHHRGFAGSPRFLGTDELGREILTFLPGEVPTDLGHFTDAQIAAAAELLRRFHDATAGFPLVSRQGAEVMCHNDWGPTNTVFRNGLPYGMIDFDTVAPGARLWDLGYSAWLWLDFGNADTTTDEQLRRLRVFADAYRLPTCPADRIAIHIVARQTALAAIATEQGKPEIAKWAASCREWTERNIAARD